MSAGPIDPTDVLAVILMIIHAMRRSDIRATDFRAFPDIPPAVFESWKTAALAPKNLAVNACFAKFMLNSIWFFGFRRVVPPRPLAAVGALLFFGWVIALVIAWRRGRKVARAAQRLGIVIGRRLDGPRGPSAGVSSSSSDSEGSSP